MSKTSQWKVGDSLPTIERQIDQRRVNSYARASGDHNPIHLDADYAATTRFGQRVAHGMLTLAFVWETIANATQGNLTGVTVKVRFTSPVIPGETVTCSGKVTKVSDSSATYDIQVMRPNGEAAIIGSATIPFAITSP